MPRRHCLAEASTCEQMRLCTGSRQHGKSTITPMQRGILLTAVLSGMVTILVLCAAGMATLPGTVKLENARVKITEVVYRPGVPRERYIRPTDQVIVFLDDSRYERIDSTTKE